MPDYKKIENIVQTDTPEESPVIDAQVSEVSENGDEISSDTSEISNDINEEIPSKDEDKDKTVETYDFASNSSQNATVTVQPVKFTSFENTESAQGEANKNLDLLMDIKLQLTVELGRTELPIRKVLELTRGSIIELEKVAGEPVELYANGKLVAHGEVVVIEDNFGLRITSITEPEDRIKGVSAQ